MYYSKILILSSCVSPIHKILPKCQKWIKRTWAVRFCFIKLLSIRRCQCIVILWIINTVGEKCVKYCTPAKQRSSIGRLSAKQCLVWFIGTAFEIGQVNLIDISENIPVLRKNYAHPISLFLLSFHPKKKTPYYNAWLWDDFPKLLVCSELLVSYTVRHQIRCFKMTLWFS